MQAHITFAVLGSGVALALLADIGCATATGNDDPLGAQGDVAGGGGDDASGHGGGEDAGDAASNDAGGNDAGPPQCIAGEALCNGKCAAISRTDTACGAGA